jgi:hypothetical protein
MDDKGQKNQTHQLSKSDTFESFVLEKSIFSNVFGKDIRRVYIYKKAERLARALNLVSPAFGHSGAMKRRAEEMAFAIVDSAVLPPLEAREALSRNLLGLSSLLSIARTTGLLSPMNAEVIGKEAHLLLEEVASYEEPRVALAHIPSLAEIAREAPKRTARIPEQKVQRQKPIGQDKGHIKDTSGKSDRRETIIRVLREKGPSYIKDISTVLREVSEKTIQRELGALVAEGVISREGERRWTRYMAKAE